MIEGDYSSTAAWAAFIICHHIAEMLLAPSSTEVPDPAVFTPPINQHFDLMAGEMNNGFVGERYS